MSNVYDAALDTLLRLSVLEGAAGETKGFWVGSGSSAAVKRGIKLAQADLPGAAPAWFGTDTTAFTKAVKAATGFANRMSPEIEAAFISQLFIKGYLYDTGKRFAQSIASGDETPDSVAPLLTSILKRLVTKEKETINRQTKNRGMDQAGPSDFNELLADAAPELFRWIDANIDRIPYTSKTGLDAHETYRAYLNAMRSGEVRSSTEFANDIGASPRTVQHIVNQFNARLKELLAENPRLLRSISDENERRLDSPSVYDHYDPASGFDRVASARENAERLLEFAGGRERLDDRLGAFAFTHDAEGVSFLIDDRKTPHGLVNWVRIWQKSGNRLGCTVGIYYHRGQKTLTVEEVNLRSLEALSGWLATNLGASGLKLTDRQIDALGLYARPEAEARVAKKNS